MADPILIAKSDQTDIYLLPKLVNRHGLIAGATFAFVLSLGDFLAPLLVGGPSSIMIANIVQSLFGSAYDWPLGAAISVCILLVTVALLFATERLEKRWSFR